MRAVIASSFGAADVLDVVDRPVPDTGGAEVSIDVDCASVTLADVLLRRGEFGGEPPLVPGLEVAGTVRGIGDGVTDLRPGDRVVTLSRPTAGGYAEVSTASAGVVVPIGDLDASVAVSAIPNTTTALLALRELGRLRPGDRVLVHGALGALGSIVAQVARTLGAGAVDGTVRRPEQVDRARAAGYDAVRTTEELLADPGDRAYDIVIDPVGGELRTASVDLLRPLGRLIVVGNATGSQVAIDTTRLWLDGIAVAGLNAGGLLASDPGLGADAARRAVELVREGSVRVEVEQLPLDAARAAHRRLEEGDVGARLVLCP